MPYWPDIAQSYPRDILSRTYWRHIARSEPPVEVTQPALEPISRSEAKQQLLIDRDLTDHDPWIDRAIVAARRQVELDCGQTFVRRTLEMTFDRFPAERFIPLPSPPLVSVTSVSSFDDDGVETTMASADYLVDANSKPGRLLLAPDTSWPTDVRNILGGKVRWVAGYSGATVTILSLTQSSNVATATTSAAHGFATGERRTIAGTDQEAYNGTFVITVVDTTRFTYAVTGSPTTPATGTLLAAGLNVPERYLHAMLLLLGHWFRHREAVSTNMTDLPLGYDALIGDRLVGVA